MSRVVPVLLIPLLKKSWVYSGVNNTILEAMQGFLVKFLSKN